MRRGVPVSLFSDVVAALGDMRITTAQMNALLDVIQSIYWANQPPSEGDEPRGT